MSFSLSTKHTFLSLLRTLSVDDMQQLIGLMIAEPDLKLFSIIDQPRERGSVPDAEISGDFKILIETKIRSGEARHWGPSAADSRGREGPRARRPGVGSHSRGGGRCFKVFLLSPFIRDEDAVPGREHCGTWLLRSPVEHRPEGRMTAYVRRQRYVDFESLKAAATTADLMKL